MNKTTTYCPIHNFEDLIFLHTLSILENRVKAHTQRRLLNYSNSLMVIPNKSKQNLLILN